MRASFFWWCIYRQIVAEYQAENVEHGHVLKDLAVATQTQETKPRLHYRAVAVKT